MGDRCQGCTVRGDLEACRAACARLGCTVPEAWGVTARIAALEAELREHCQVEADELAGIDARLSGEPRDATRTPAWLIGWDGQDVDMARCARIAALEAALAAKTEECLTLQVRLTAAAARAAGYQLACADAEERGAREVLRYHYADSDEPELTAHVEEILARWRESRTGGQS